MYGTKTWQFPAHLYSMYTQSIVLLNIVHSHCPKLIRHSNPQRVFYFKESRQWSKNVECMKNKTTRALERERFTMEDFHGEKSIFDMFENNFVHPNFSKLSRHVPNFFIEFHLYTTSKTWWINMGNFRRIFLCTTSVATSQKFVTICLLHCTYKCFSVSKK